MKLPYMRQILRSKYPINRHSTWRIAPWTPCSCTKAANNNSLMHWIREWRTENIGLRRCIGLSVIKYLISSALKWKDMESFVIVCFNSKIRLVFLLKWSLTSPFSTWNQKQKISLVFCGYHYGEHTILRINLMYTCMFRNSST